LKSIGTDLFFDVETKKIFRHSYKLSDPDMVFASMDENGIIELVKGLYEKVSQNGFVVKKWKSSIVLETFRIGEKQ